MNTAAPVDGSLHTSRRAVAPSRRLERGPREAGKPIARAGRGGAGHLDLRGRYAIEDMTERNLRVVKEG